MRISNPLPACIRFPDLDHGEEKAWQRHGLFLPAAGVLKQGASLPVASIASYTQSYPDVLKHVKQNKKNWGQTPCYHWFLQRSNPASLATMNNLWSCAELLQVLQQRTGHAASGPVGNPRTNYIHWPHWAADYTCWTVSTWALDHCRRRHRHCHRKPSLSREAVLMDFNANPLI